MTLWQVVPGRWKATYALSLWTLASMTLCVTARLPDTVETTRKHLTHLRAQEETRTLHLVGHEERARVSDPETFPYSAIGLLRWNDDVTCTATLIASDLIVTAAECVLASNGQLLETSTTGPTFRLPQTAHVPPASITRVYKQSDFWTKWTWNAYVIVGLDASIGMTTGALNLPTAAFFEDAVFINVQLVDFGNKEEEEAAPWLQACNMFLSNERRDQAQYMVRHTCDVSAKRSRGAPMLIRSTNLDTYIIGIHANAIDPTRTMDARTQPVPSDNDTAPRHGVLGSFIQPHFAFLVQQADALVAQHDDSADDVKTKSLSSSSSVPASPAPVAIQTSVPAPHLDLSNATAYSCIGVVGAAWLAIIIAAARRLCSNRRARIWT